MDDLFAVKYFGHACVAKITPLFFSVEITAAKSWYRRGSFCKIRYLIGDRVNMAVHGPTELICG